MKTKLYSLQRTTLCAFLMLGLLAFEACKKDNNVDPVTLRINELSASWNLSSVVNDNSNVTDQFTGFRLSIDGLSYTTQNGGNVWPSVGSYDFRDNDLIKIIRSDDVTVTIEEITVSTLILSFQMPEIATGRTSGITGDFIFSLTK